MDDPAGLPQRCRGRHVLLSAPVSSAQSPRGEAAEIYYPERAGCLVPDRPHRGYLPNDFPPAETVRQQAHRWFEAGCFETAVHDLRILSRVERSRNGEPTAIIIDSRTLQSTPESGHRAGVDGAKKRKGTKVHLAVDTLGHLLAVLTTPANEQDRAQVKDLCL